MASKQVPPVTDERTKIISNSSSNILSGKQSTKSVSPFAPYFKNGNKKVKRTIVAGAISGSLITTLFSIHGFTKKDKEPSGKVADVTETETPSLSEGDMVTINSGQQIYTRIHYNLSLEETRELAREQIGADGLFIHNGAWHLGISNEEFANLANEERLELINNTTILPASIDHSITVPVVIDGRTIDVHIDPIHRGNLIQEGWDDNGNFYVVPMDRPAFIMENVVHEDDGINYWVDPATGSRYVFDIVEFYHQINDTGAANVQTFLPGSDDVIAEADYIYNEIENAGDNEQTDSENWQEGWGWDTDTDGAINIPDTDQPVDTWVEEQDGQPIIESTTYPDGHIEYPETDDQDVAENGIGETDQDQQLNTDEPTDQNSPDVIVNGELMDNDSNAPDSSPAENIVTGEIMQDSPEEIVAIAEVISSPDEDQPIEMDSGYDQDITDAGTSFIANDSDRDKDAGI